MSGGTLRQVETLRQQRQAEQCQEREGQRQRRQAEDRHQQPTEQHADQAAQAVEAVVQAHGAAALVVGGAVDHRRESADAEERPADPPQSAQQHPGQETAGQAVAGGAQHADDDRQEQAGLQCQVLVQAADQRIEGQADQAVDRQQHADLPERLQADLVPVDRQGDIKHRVAGQA